MNADNPVKLASFPDDFSAALVVNALESAGIAAKSVGGFVSGFQAEAPGMVDILVSSGDLEFAKSILAEFQQNDENQGG